MESEALRGHTLVIISTLAGIVGMGMMFGGAMHGNLHAMLQGAPFLLLGLWWAGRELGRSIVLSRSHSTRRKVQPSLGRGLPIGSGPDISDLVTERSIQPKGPHGRGPSHSTDQST